MSIPDQNACFAAMDATWPAAAFHNVDPWVLRQGNGGGQRVSAATATGPVSEYSIGIAETGMRDLGQHPLFMIRDGEAVLDDLLAARGYEVVDPVVLYAAPVAALMGELEMTAAIPSWPPLAMQREMWARCGTDAARIAVMERAAGPKAAVLGRVDDTPSGVGFVALSDGIAMVHSLEVLPDRRRAGVGRNIMRGAANWAEARGGDWLALAVTQANGGANALYQSIGMQVVTRYHYRRAPKGAA